MVKWTVKKIRYWHKLPYTTLLEEWDKSSSRVRACLLRLGSNEHQNVSDLDDEVPILVENLRVLSVVFGRVRGRRQAYYATWNRLLNYAERKKQKQMVDDYRKRSEESKRMKKVLLGLIPDLPPKKRKHVRQTCLVCGKQLLPGELTTRQKFCGRRCKANHYYRQHKQRKLRSSSAPSPGTTP